jgi:serine/threonine protein kinase
MLADFGLSKYLAEIKSNSMILGMPAYIEPQSFINKNHKRNEKSDIYSLGVLFWEISSGKPPFSGIFVYKIILDIVKGIRETPVDNTPFEYQQIYNNENVNINSAASYSDSNLKILFIYFYCYLLSNANLAIKNF